MKLTIGMILVWLALMFGLATTAQAKNLRADGSTESLNFQTNGKNTRMHIDSAGEVFFDLLTQDRVPYIGTSGQVLESLLFTFDGSDLIFPLTDGTILVGNGSNQKAEVTMSGDVSIDNTGVASIGSGVIVDADVNAAAAIARSKMANGTADYVLINNGSGGISEEQFLGKTRGGAGADMSSVTFPSTGTLATLAGTEDLSNKTFTDPITVEEQGSTPSNPATGDKKFYCKTDDKCYFLNDAGTEVEIGAAGGSSFTNITMTGYLDASEIATPATPAAGIGRCYFDSTEAQWACVDDGGNAKVYADYQETAVTLDNNFTGGEVTITKIGKKVTVTLTTSATHASLSAASSSAGLIPSWARPTNNIAISASCISTTVPLTRIDVSTGGTYRHIYYDEAFAVASQTGLSGTCSLTYNLE